MVRNTQAGEVSGSEMSWSKLTPVSVPQRTPLEAPTGPQLTEMRRCLDGGAPRGSKGPLKLVEMLRCMNGRSEQPRVFASGLQLGP